MLARGGFVIRKMRKMRGYTQQRLAIEYGYHVNTISAWECGVKEPSFLTVFEIGRHLHFDIMNIYQLANDISKEVSKAA